MHQEREKRKCEVAEHTSSFDGPEIASKKRRKTAEELERRARRVTMRLASMGNRCFWVSAAELVLHMLTDGDCLQSHRHQRIFTRHLQWAMQQCKRQLNQQCLSKLEIAKVSLNLLQFERSRQRTRPSRVTMRRMRLPTETLPMRIRPKISVVLFSLLRRKR